MRILRQICALSAPEFMRTTFIIIVDDPAVSSQRMKQLMEALQHEADPHECRMRQNAVRAAEKAEVEEFGLLLSLAQIMSVVPTRASLDRLLPGQHRGGTFT